jgi:mediator of RNA polymerase II transcription subunit 23
MSGFQVGAVIGSLKDVRPSGWALTEQYQQYLAKKDPENNVFLPDGLYYMELVRRLLDSKRTLRTRKLSF